MSSADRTLPGSGEDTKAVAPSFGFGQRRDASQPMTFSFRRSAVPPRSSQTLPTQTPSDESADMPVRCHHPAAVAGPTGSFLKRPTVALPAVAPPDTKAAVVSPDEEPAAAVVPPTRPRAPHSLASSHFVPELAPYEPTRWTPFGAVMATASTRALVSFFATLHETQVSLPPLAPMVLHMVNDDAVQRRITLEPTHDPIEVLSSPNWWRDVAMFSCTALSPAGVAPRLRSVVIAKLSVGEGPDRDDATPLAATLTSLASVSTLRQLILRCDCSDSVSGALASLRSLRTLDLSRSDVTDACVEAVATLPCLEALNLAECPRVTDVRCLAQSTSLTDLNLRGVTSLQQHGIDGVERVPTLAALALSVRNETVMIGPLLGSASSLTSLHVEGIKTASQLADLQRCESLRVVTLSQFGMSVDMLRVIGALPALEAVCLIVPELNCSNVFSALRNVQTLTSLVVRTAWYAKCCDLTECLTRCFTENLKTFAHGIPPNLKTLRLLSVNFKSTAPMDDTVFQCHSLTSLSLWASSLLHGDHTWHAIARLPCVTVLELRALETNADDVLTHLSTMPSLTRLTLTDMTFGKSTALPSLRTVESLTIWNPMAMSSDACRSVAAMPSLRRFTFSSETAKVWLKPLFDAPLQLHSLHLHHHSFASRAGYSALSALPPSLRTLGLIDCAEWRYALKPVMEATSTLQRLITRGIPVDVTDRLRTAMPTTRIVCCEQEEPRDNRNAEELEGVRGDFLPSEFC